MGKINTETLLIIVGGAIAVYMITRPAVSSLPLGYPTLGQPLTALQQQQLLTAGNPTAQDIQAGGSALQGLATVIGNLF